jgi:hypothetical protein
VASSSVAPPAGDYDNAEQERELVAVDAAEHDHSDVCQTQSGATSFGIAISRGI